MLIISLSYMFGHDKSEVESSMNPNGKIHKRHVALSFHRGRESIAAGIVSYQFVDGKITQQKYCASIGHIMTFGLLSSLSYSGQETLWSVLEMTS